MNNFHSPFLNEKLEQLYSYGDVVFFVWKNEEGWPLEFVSPNCQQLLGYQQADFLQSVITYSDLIHEDDIERVTQEVIENSDSSSPVFTHQDYRIKTKDNIYIWVKDTTILDRDKSGKIKYYIGHIHDVTASHELLHQSQLSAIGELSGGLAHEIKNPLGAISLASEILLKQLKDKITESELKKLQMIQHSANKINKTIKGMLKLASKRDDIEREVHVLKDIFDDIIPIFEDKLKQFAITIKLDIDSQHSVYCDELTISQVIINLIQNAIDAVKEQQDSYIHITSSCQSNITNILLQDSGCNFDYTLKDKIFAPFFSTKDKKHGSGIGLHLCRSFMKLNQGQIKLVSNPNTPTTFQISLPSLP
jgi:PAS domain S-box-containing protein